MKKAANKPKNPPKKAPIKSIKARITMSKANPIISKDIEVNKLANALNRVVVDEGVLKTSSRGRQIRPTRPFEQLKN